MSIVGWGLRGAAWWSKTTRDLAPLHQMDGGGSGDSMRLLLWHRKFVPGKLDWYLTLSLSDLSHVEKRKKHGAYPR